MIWAGFIFGILGSFHCVGMCGAIALALPGAGQSGWRYVLGRVLYNLGRVTTYAALGLVVGLFGQSLQLAGAQQAISIAAGVLILLLVLLPAANQSKIANALGLPPVMGWVKQKLAYYFQRTSLAALYTTGLFNGLLPCGFVYIALAGALAMPSVPAAMGYMALFGLGTLPLMLALSLSGKLISFKTRSFLNKAVPYVAVSMALIFILRGLSLGIPYISPKVVQTAEQTIEMDCCTKAEKMARR